MKKLLSVMLSVVMLVSLFAVSASAEVTHGTAVTTVAAQDYSDVENNGFMTVSAYGDADTEVVDGAMKVTFAQEGATYVQVKASKDYVDFTKLPDVFYFDFDVKAVNASLPILVGFSMPTKDEEGKAVDGRIGVRVFPGCFNPEITITSAYKEDSTLFDVNKTLSFRVMVDQSKYYADRENLISAGLTDAQLYDVIKVYKRGEGEFYTEMAPYKTGGNFVYEQGYRTGSKGSIVTMGYSNGDALGIVVNKAMDDNSFAANTEYYFDNLRVTWEEEIPAKGIVACQDYEGTSIVATKASYGDAAPAVSEDGNRFIRMFNKDKGVNVLLMPADGADFTIDDVTVAFDVCAQKPGAIGVEAYGKTDDITSNKQESMLFVRTDEGIEVGKWYRVKMSFGGDIVNRVAVKNLTDNGEWEVLKYGSNGSESEANKEFGVGTCGSSGSGRIRIISVYDDRRQPEGADPTDVEWWIDNIMITNTEAISFPNVEVTDEKINVAVDFESGKVLRAESMKAMIAVYDSEHRLVDVAMDTKATAAGEMLGATLSVDKAAYTADGEIKLLVWDGSETAAPIISEAYDISALLK